MQSVSDRHAIPVLYPVADAFAGTVTSDVVEAQGEGVLFEITKGVGTTGTSTITVLSADDTTPSNTTAVTFIYRASTTPDTWGAWTAAAVAGFTTTAGSNQMYQIYVDNGQLAANNYRYVQLKAVEVADDPVLGGINAYIENTRFADQPSSLIDQISFIMSLVVAMPPAQNKGVLRHGKRTQ